MTGAVDASSIVGKLAAPETKVDVLVVGAGPAGAAAATELASSGLLVMLVDEHPLDAGLIGLDVPYYFGGRASVSAYSKGRMIEQIFASDPALETAVEAGVDLALGIS